MNTTSAARRFSARVATYRLPEAPVITVVAAIVGCAGFVASASAQTSQGADELEEIVVVGTRASLRRSLEIKRDATGIVDAIVAEDIGKFPDLNLSESLQRITGVTIDREVSGEGNRISLRGLAPELTRVTLNGMTAATGSQGREFDFDVFPSELFSGATVMKTPSAELTEGGLAGTIDLAIPGARQVGDRFGFAAGGQYSELGDDETKPRLYGIVSKTLDQGRWGFIGSASYSESFIRGDTVEGFRFESIASRTQLDELVDAALANGTPVPTVNVNGVDVNDPETLLEIADRVNIAILVRDQLWTLDRERLGLTAGVEFVPSDSAAYRFDVMYARMDESGGRHIFSGTPAFSGPIVIPTALTITGDYALQASFDPLFRGVTSQDNRVDTDFLHSTLRGTVDLSDALTMRLRAGYSEATERTHVRDYDYVSPGPFTYDMSNAHYPQFTMPGFDIFDATQFSPNRVEGNRTDVSDELYEVGGDLEQRFNNELQAIKVGVEYRSREKIRDQYRIRVANGEAAPLAEIVSSEFPVSGFLDDAPAGAFTNFLTVDFAAAETSNLPRSLMSSAPPRPEAYYDVTEEIASGYVQADLAFELAGRPLDANLGFRVTRTNQTSEGFLLAGGEITPIVIKQEYTDALPSLNVRWSLSDTLIARLAANRAITRPTLSQLGPGTTASGTSLNGTAGNPLLEPFRADQIDIGLEWYFGDEALLAGSIFYKDVESFIVTANVDRVVVGEGLFDGAGNNVSGSVFSIRTPLNGVGGHVQGIELTYQQPFSFLRGAFEGFGLLANLTLADSEGTLEFNNAIFRERLQNQSDLSYNVIAYYDRGSFSARAAYSFRGDYVAQYRGVRSNGDLWTFTDDDRNQLDLAIRYRLGDHANLYLDAINVNDAGTYRYDTQPFLNAFNYDQGTVYNFGVRIDFQGT